MAEDHRAPGADVVDEAPAVFGLDVGTARAADEERLAADARNARTGEFTPPAM
jgi:hypothetical protein